MAAVKYETENLIAGEIKTDQAPLAADTYYRGMVLTYNAGNNNYEYNATPAQTDTIAIYLGQAQATSRAVSANNYDSIIVGGELYESGLTTDAGAAFTMTEDLRAIMAQAGFYIKRK